MKRHTTTTTTTNRFSILPLLAVVVSLAQSSLQSPSSSPPLGKAASNEKFIRYAEEVGWDRGPRSLWTRQTEDLIGSWSLRSLSCPQDTQDCGKPKAARACCPNSSICTSYIYAFYCCPTKNSCLETAQTLPRCGDPNWSLWRSRPDNFFCCLPGQKGYITNSDGGACGDEGLVLAPSQVATSATQYFATGGGAPVPQPTGTSRTTAKPSSTNKSDIPNSTLLPNGGDGSSATTSPKPNPSSTGLSPSGGGGDGTIGGTTNPPSTTTDKKSTGLSTGIIVGIAVGALIILALFVLGIFWALRVGRKKGAANALAAARIAIAEENARLAAAAGTSEGTQQMSEQQFPGGGGGGGGGYASPVAGGLQFNADGSQKYIYNPHNVPHQADHNQGGYNNQNNNNAALVNPSSYDDRLIQTQTPPPQWAPTDNNGGGGAYTGPVYSEAEGTIAAQLERRAEMDAYSTVQGHPGNIRHE